MIFFYFFPNFCLWSLSLLGVGGISWELKRVEELFGGFSETGNDLWDLGVDYCGCIVRIWRGWMGIKVVFHVPERLGEYSICSIHLL